MIDRIARQVQRRRAYEQAVARKAYEQAIEQQTKQHRENERTNGWLILWSKIN